MAQRDIRPGYIITTRNDTISGQIVYKDAFNRFEKCVFIQSNNNDQKSYSPSELNGYGITDSRVYMSKSLPLDSVSPTRVFAEVAVSGKASLLIAFDHYFLSLGNDKIYELAQTKTTIYKNGAPYIHTAKTYQGILKVSLADCPKVAGMIDKTAFTSSSISRLINKYNECFSTGAGKLKAKNKRLTAQLGISSGYSSVTLSGFESSQFHQRVDPAQFGKDRNFYPGISLELNSTFVKENLALHVDLFYQKNSVGSYYEYPRSSVETWNYTTSWKFNSLNAPITLVYYILGSKTGVRLFIEGGVSPYLIFNNQFYFQYDTKFLPGDPVITRVDTSEWPQLVKNNQMSLLFLGGTGITYRPASRIQLAAKFRYENGSFNIKERDALKKTNLSTTASILFKISK